MPKKQQPIIFSSSDEEKMDNSFVSSVESGEYVYDDKEQFFNKATKMKQMIAKMKNENQFLAD